MNGIDFLADSNILLYILEGQSGVQSFMQNTFAVSVITELELLGWYKISKSETQIIKGLLSNCLIVELLPAIKDIAIKLRQAHKIKLPDAIIAATAIYLQVPILTADKELAKVKEANVLLIEI